MITQGHRVLCEQRDEHKPLRGALKGSSREDSFGAYELGGITITERVHRKEKLTSRA